MTAVLLNCAYLDGHHIDDGRMCCEAIHAVGCGVPFPSEGDVMSSALLWQLHIELCAVHTRFNPPRTIT